MWYEEGSFVDLWSCDERWNDEGWTRNRVFDGCESLHALS